MHAYLFKITMVQYCEAFVEKSIFKSNDSFNSKYFFK